MSKTVFVTGGSGFIGGAVIERLVADGNRVVALARSDSAAARVGELGAEAARGDLDSIDAMRIAMSGAELAIHCAAVTEEWGKREHFERVNVKGTENLLQAARAAGVPRVVHVGTESALVNGQPLHLADETYPLAPESKALYSSTKAKAEMVVRAANEPGSFETVVLRPRFVWGKGDTTLLPELVAAVDSGRFAWIAGGRHRTSTTHIRNTVEGIMLAAGRGKAGEAYFVTDGEPVEFRTFVTRLLATQQVEEPKREVPRPVAAALAAGSEGLWKVFPLPGSPPMSRLAYWLLSLECTLDDSKARSELGYRPVVTIEEGLAELDGQIPSRP